MIDMYSAPSDRDYSQHLHPECWWDDEDPDNGQGMDDIPAAVPLTFDEAQPDDPTF